MTWLERHDPAVGLVGAGVGACGGRLGADPAVLFPETVPEAPADTVEIA